MIDDHALLTQHLDVHPHVLEDIHDHVRLELNLVNKCLSRLDHGHPLLCLADPLQRVIKLHP